MTDWMQEISKKENNEKFSLLCNHYFRLATMRVMQVMRAEYNIPSDELININVAIWARFLNESCYAVGSALRHGIALNDIMSKEHLNNLVKILSNESLDFNERTDIETDYEIHLKKLKEFISENGKDFYI